MEFEMNGIKYKIQEISQKKYKTYRKQEDEKTDSEMTDTKQGVYFGATHGYINVIFLDESLPLDRKIRTLKHELTHCYISEYITHEEHTYTEEQVADICANSHTIISQIVHQYLKNYNK